MTLIGVLAGRWRASVTDWGAIRPWDGLPGLDWYVAADDRWHVPADEPTVRQTRVAGTPVVETRLRIPNGDAAQRVYAVADHGGYTVVEITNESPLPIAVAFTGAPLASARPPAAVPIDGIDLPAPATVFPIGHHATLRVAVAHDDSGADGVLPANLPDATQVSKGWLAVCGRASRFDLPDESLAEAVIHERCELLLGGPPDLDDDPIGFLLAAAQLVRLGDRPDGWVPDVAEAVHRVARAEQSWDLDAALDAAEFVFAAGDECRALRDLARLRAGRPATVAPPDPHTLWGVRLVAAVERRLAAGPTLFPAGIPVPWYGQHFEAHGLPVGPSTSASFAVRWHGPRPAVLWETSGESAVLEAPVVAPGWSTAERSGEALWPAPADITPV